jgi:thioredoxin-related protein
MSRFANASSKGHWALFRFAVLGLLLGLTATVQAAPGRDPSQYFFNQSFGDLKEEAQTAKQEGKTGVLIMFEEADCPWCHRMKTTVLNQVPVQEYYRKHFRILAVDTKGGNPLTDFNGKQTTEKAFAFRENRVRATPTFIFYGTDGKRLTRYTGITRNPEEFLWLGEFVVDGHYKDQKFTVYKRKKRAASQNNS